MTDVRLGQVRPTRMRRIGARHMLVLPAQQAQVLSLDDIEIKLRQARQQRAQLQQQIGRLDAFVADLEQQVATFKALPIERDEDDPEVPQAEPVLPPALVEANARGRAGMRQLQGLPEHLRAVTPVGHGIVPEGATPVPPPELTAADA
jgi:cell division protein FtsB